MLAAPVALLLDFGGVIVESDRNVPNPNLEKLIARVHQLVQGALTEPEIADELRRADDLRSELRDRSTEHHEFTHVELWGDLVADLWPDKAKEAVVRHASELTYLWAFHPGWRLRPGIPELLEHTLSVGLQVAVVSNTRCGRAHRDMLDNAGLSGAFAAQIYSDELGFAKPHPEMIRAAARELDVPVARCWFVGDQLDKDIACARNAGAGAAILMPDGEVKPSAHGFAPDMTVASGLHLLALLRGVKDADA